MRRRYRRRRLAMSFDVCWRMLTHAPNAQEVPQTSFGSELRPAPIQIYEFFFDWEVEFEKVFYQPLFFFQELLSTTSVYECPKKFSNSQFLILHKALYRETIIRPRRIKNAPYFLSCISPACFELIKNAPSSSMYSLCFSVSQKPGVSNAEMWLRCWV